MSRSRKASTNWAGFDISFNTSANTSQRVYAREAMTIDLVGAPRGTGALSYSKSTAASPGTDTGATMPVTLEAGAWLTIAATGVSGLLSAHFARTA